MLSALAALALSTVAQTPPPPAPFGAVPSKRQLAWHDLETYAFVHFGPNTFTAKEWGDGQEDPALFNPTALDTDQWCRVFRDAGLKAVIVTAKHHDGFCLWPSRQSTHTVAQSPWKDGQGDLLKDLATSCRKYGLKFGVYVSPWDRNHPDYGTDGYNDVFVATLNEVLTGYGPVFEVWFDGANGEGPNGKRQIYDWPRFHETVRKLQPNAVMFSDAGPDVRWVGNEAGHAAPTSWSTINRDRYVPGTPLYAELAEGHAEGTHWVPSESDVSIRKGWFWKESENDTVKSPETLLDLYVRSVGQNSAFLLNVPPDTRGLVHERDTESLLGFAELRKKLFARRVSDSGSFSASSTRGNHRGYSPERLLDDDRQTYWATDDDVHQATLTLRWDSPTRFDTLVFQEPIQLGQRIAKYFVQSEKDGQWTTIAEGTTIGAKRIFRVDRQEASAVRIVILESLACPALATFHLFDSDL